MCNKIWKINHNSNINWFYWINQVDSYKKPFSDTIIWCLVKCSTLESQACQNYECPFLACPTFQCPIFACPTFEWPLNLSIFFKCLPCACKWKMGKPWCSDQRQMSAWTIGPEHWDPSSLVLCTGTSHPRKKYEVWLGCTNTFFFFFFRKLFSS